MRFVYLAQLWFDLLVRRAPLSLLACVCVLVAVVFIAYPVWLMHWELAEFTGALNKIPFAREITVDLWDFDKHTASIDEGRLGKAVDLLRRVPGVAMVERTPLDGGTWKVRRRRDGRDLAEGWRAVEPITFVPDQLVREAPVAGQGGKPQDPLFGSGDRSEWPNGYAECAVSDGLASELGGAQIGSDLEIMVTRATALKGSERGADSGYQIQNLKIRAEIPHVPAYVVVVHPDLAVAVDAYAQGVTELIASVSDEGKEGGGLGWSGLRVSVKTVDDIPGMVKKIEEQLADWTPHVQPRLGLAIAKVTGRRANWAKWRLSSGVLVVCVWVFTVGIAGSLLCARALADLLTLERRGCASGVAWWFSVLPLFLVNLVAFALICLLLWALRDVEFVSSLLESSTGGASCKITSEHRWREQLGLMGRVGLLSVGTWLVTWLFCGLWATRVMRRDRDRLD